MDRGDDYGLDVYFYDTNPELNSFQKDKFSDQYLMGAKISKAEAKKIAKEKDELTKRQKDADALRDKLLTFELKTAKKTA